MDTEELILVGSYKQMKLEHHYLLKNVSEKDLGALIAHISEEIEGFAYPFAGIDTAKVESIAKEVSSKETLINYLERTKPGQLKERLIAACKVKELLPAAESLFIKTILKNAGIGIKPQASNTITDSKEKPEDVIAFIGNAKKWFAAKKLSVDKTTQEWEVAGILSGINFSLMLKVFDFAGVTRDDAKVEGILKGKRKGLAMLAQVIKEMPVDNPYVVCKVCEGVGYSPYLQPKLLSPAYPDIKPPKVKGRKPKG